MLHNWNMLPNDNISMSVEHLDHVLIVYSLMEHVTWKSPGTMCGWVGRILTTHPHMGSGDFQLHRAVNNQDVIKMFDGHRNVVIR